MSDYNIDEHTHRFAVWAAARAASKSRLSNKEAASLIEFIRLKEKVEKLRNINPLTDSIYHHFIRDTGLKMVKKVKQTIYPITKKENYKTNNFTFGLAAKMISIYIKAAEVIPSKGKSALSIIAYPPLDSILLKNINSKYKLGLKYQWSTFNWQQYENVIRVIKNHYNDVPMWKVETEWNI